MRVFLLLVCFHLFGGVNNLKAQDVSLPLGPFRDFLMSRYPSCFVNTNGNGELMLNTSCTAITTEDSLEFHNMGFTGSSLLDLTGLEYFTSLVYLNMSNNRILTYVFPPNLKYLDCTFSMEITPFGIFPAFPASLETLICKDNGAGVIPFSPNLKYIDISGNYCSSLDPLPNGLEKLICKNQCSESGISRLSYLPALPSSLKYLDCSNNALLELPTLPASLDTLICPFQFEYFGPGDNHWNKVLDSLPALPASLKYLDCSNNILTSLPSLPVTLKYLNCSKQRTFARDVMSMPSIPEELFFEGISSLPALPNGLLYLDCSRNKLTSLPSSLPTSLTHLNAGDNIYTYITQVQTEGIRCLPHIPASVSTLITNGTLIGCYPNSGSYSATPSLPLCSSTNNSNLCQYSPVLSGHIFCDNNSNGVQDPGENYRANVRVALNNSQVTFSNSNGYYELSGDLGTNNISIDNPPFYQAVPAAVSHTISRYDTIVHDLIALQPSGLSDSLRINVIPLITMRRGFYFSYVVKYENIGTINISPQISLTYNGTNLIYLNSTNLAVTATGNTLHLTDNNLTPGTARQFTANFNVIPAAALGDTVRAQVQAIYGSNQTTDSCYSVVRGSFDPNDKQSTPSLTVPDVASGKYIDYLVRFQNTGTDTAFNIVLTDVLDNQLDASSFELLQTSHTCKVTRTGNNLTFEFLHIQLPDSNTNEPASHGFVLFRVKPLSTVGANSVIQNNVNIYFDFNSPVLTNTANTLIQLSPVPVTIFSLSGQMLPGSKNVLIQWETRQEWNTDHFEVEASDDGIRFNQLGMVRANRSGQGQYSFLTWQIRHLSYYRLRIVDQNGRFSYSPIIRIVGDIKRQPIVLLGNPVSAFLRLQLLDKTWEGTNGRIISPDGKTLISFTWKSGTQQIPIGQLTDGPYFIKTASGTWRFIKLSVK